MSKRTRISVRLVGKPGKLDEETRHVLNALDATCFPQDPLYNKDNCFWWIVYANDVPMGFAGLFPNPSTTTAFLCRAGVCQKASHKGIQRKLIDARIRYARRIGTELVETYTAIWNHKSIANLVRAGLHITKIDAEFAHFEMKI